MWLLDQQFAVQQMHAVSLPDMAVASVEANIAALRCIPNYYAIIEFSFPVPRHMPDCRGSLCKLTSWQRHHIEV